MRVASPTAVARHLSFVRETLGPNLGAWVEFIQRFAGGAAGDSWCCEFVCLIEDIAYRGHAPTLRTGACQDKLDDARRKGYEVATPAVDDLYFYLDANNHAHHIGIVTGLAPLTGIAGNTSEDGTSSNGTGVFEHTIGGGRMAFVRLPA